MHAITVWGNAETVNQIEQGTDTLVTTDDKLSHSIGKRLLIFQPLNPADIAYNVDR